MIHPAAVAAMLVAAWGPSQTPRIEWSAPESCPDRAALEDSIEQYLGRELEGSTEAPLTAEARVDGAPGGFSLSLEITTEAGQGRTEADNAACEVLTRLAALKIAIAIDPQAGLGRPPSGESTPPPGPAQPATPGPPLPPANLEPPASPAPAPPTPPSSPPAPPSSPPPRLVGLSVGLGVSAQWGMLPRGAAGLGASLGLRVRRFGLYGSFDQWLSPATDIAPPHPGVVLVRASTGRVAGCWALVRRPTLEAPLCAGFEGGGITARARGLENNRRTQQPWLATLLGPHLVWVPTPRLAWWLGASLVVPMLRPGLRTDDRGLFHRAAPVGVRPTTSIEFRFR